MKLISESGLYALIMRSNKAQAVLSANQLVTRMTGTDCLAQLDAKHRLAWKDPCQ